MEDRFGIAQGVTGALEVYFRAGRRTGRTTAMLRTLRDGDRVVFADRAEARRVELLCRERGLKIDCLVLPPSEAFKLTSLPRSKGNTVFDHSWLEQFYRDSLKEATRWLVSAGENLSSREPVIPDLGRFETVKWHV